MKKTISIIAGLLFIVAFIMFFVMARKKSDYKNGDSEKWQKYYKKQINWGIITIVSLVISIYTSA